MAPVQGADMAQAHCSQEPETEYSELFSQMETMRLRVEGVTEDTRQLGMFAEEYEERTTNQAYLNTIRGGQNRNKEIEAHLQLKVERLNQSLQRMLPQLIGMPIRILDKLQKNIASLNVLQGSVLDTELIRWKREQQLSGNGAPMISNLNTIQEWCERLAGMIWQTRDQVKEMSQFRDKLDIEMTGIDNLPLLEKQITQLLSTLVTSTFVIEKQPPQVIKIKHGFTSTVRFLVGGQLSVHMTPPQVKVIMISEKQAQALLKKEKMEETGGLQLTEMYGKISKNTACMEYQPTNRQLSVNFRNMQLSKIKRAEKKGTESVMDEKLSLLFQSQFNVGELVFQAWALSLPVVVIVHGSQEPQGWATVTWDNAFAAPGRIPFAVPDKVPWLQMAETLNLKFTAETGRPLSQDHLRFLAEKLFRTTNLPPNMNDLNHMAVSWTQFCKEPLLERNFTFWAWFYRIMKLTREHLRGPWAEGLIHGFLRKKQAEDMLSQCGPGTFLLRFSDSEPGGITIAYVRDGNGLSPRVFSVQPFTSRNLSFRSIADQVSDLKDLTILYPDRRKDQAFLKFYTPPDTEPISRNGYVKPSIVTQLPWSVGFRAGSYAGTPHHASSPHSMQLPDSRDTPCLQQGFTPATMGDLGPTGQIYDNWMDIALGPSEDYGIGGIADAGQSGSMLPGLPTPGLPEPVLPLYGIPTAVMGRGMPLIGADEALGPSQDYEMDFFGIGGTVDAGQPGSVLPGLPTPGLPEPVLPLYGIPTAVMGRGMPLIGADEALGPSQDYEMDFFGIGGIVDAGQPGSVLPGLPTPGLPEPVLPLSAIPTAVEGQGMPPNDADGAEPGPNSMQQN